MKQVVFDVGAQYTLPLRREANQDPINLRST